MRPRKAGTRKRKVLAAFCEGALKALGNKAVFEK